MIWWTVLFMVLPWGNQSKDTQDIDGEIISAPQKPQIKKKFLITSVLSLVLLVIIASLIEFNVIDFREISSMLMKESLDQ